VHADRVVRAQLLRDRGVAVQAQAVPDQRHQPVDVQVVGVLVGDEDVGDAVEVDVRRVDTGVQDDGPAVGVEADAGMAVLRQSHVLDPMSAERAVRGRYR